MLSKILILSTLLGIISCRAVEEASIVDQYDLGVQKDLKTNHDLFLSVDASEVDLNSTEMDLQSLEDLSIKCVAKTIITAPTCLTPLELSKFCAQLCGDRSDWKGVECSTSPYCCYQFRCFSW